jgi:hypothetical protein
MKITIQKDPKNLHPYLKKYIAIAEYSRGFWFWKKDIKRIAYGQCTVWHWEDTGRRCSLGWECILSDAWSLYRRENGFV